MTGSTTKKNGEENRDRKRLQLFLELRRGRSDEKEKDHGAEKTAFKKNAYLLLFLSQGVPLLMAGDEFRKQPGRQ